MIKIGIDLDGVIIDIHRVWLDMYNFVYRDTMTVDSLTSWDIDKLVKPECGRRIFDLLEFCYPDAPPVEGALGGIEELEGQGFEIYFVTSGFYLEKYKWMKRYNLIADLFDKHLIVCTDKRLINLSLLIDDNPKAIKDYPHIGFLFDQPWNRSAIVKYRVLGWPGILQIIGNVRL